MNNFSKSHRAFSWKALSGARLLYISLFLLFIAPASFAANVVFTFTNQMTGLPDTNVVKISPTQPPWQDADGTVHTIGFPVNIYPTNPPGSITWSNMQPGFYIAQNKFLVQNFGAGQPTGTQGIRFYVDNTTNTYSFVSAGHVLNGANTYNFYSGIANLSGTNGINIIQAGPGVFIVDGSNFLATLSFNQITNALGGQPWIAFAVTNVLGTNGVTTIAPPWLYVNTNYDPYGTAWAMGFTITNFINQSVTSLTVLISSSSNTVAQAVNTLAAQTFTATSGLTNRIDNDSNVIMTAQNALAASTTQAHVNLTNLVTSASNSVMNLLTGSIGTLGSNTTNNTTAAIAAAAGNYMASTSSNPRNGAGVTNIPINQVSSVLVTNIPAASGHTNILISTSAGQGSFDWTLLPSGAGGSAASSNNFSGQLNFGQIFPAPDTNGAGLAAAQIVSNAVVSTNGIIQGQLSAQATATTSASNVVQSALASTNAVIQGQLSAQTTATTTASNVVVVALINTNSALQGQLTALGNNSTNNGTVVSNGVLSAVSAKGFYSTNNPNAFQGFTNINAGVTASNVDGVYLDFTGTGVIGPFNFGNNEILANNDYISFQSSTLNFGFGSTTYGTLTTSGWSGAGGGLTGVNAATLQNLTTNSLVNSQSGFSTNQTAYGLIAPTTLGIGGAILWQSDTNWVGCSNGVTKGTFQYFNGAVSYTNTDQPQYSLAQSAGTWFIYTNTLAGSQSAMYQNSSLTGQYSAIGTQPTPAPVIFGGGKFIIAGWNIDGFVHSTNILNQITNQADYWAKVESLSATNGLGFMAYQSANTIVTNAQVAYSVQGPITNNAATATYATNAGNAGSASTATNALGIASAGIQVFTNGYFNGSFNSSQSAVVISNAVQSGSKGLFDVNQGSYVDWGELKLSGMNWYLGAGTTITLTNLDSDFTDPAYNAGFLQDSNPIVANVFGNADFLISFGSVIANEGTAIGALTLTVTNSIVTWQCNSITCTNLGATGGQGNGVLADGLNLQYAGYANVTVNKIEIDDYDGLFGDGLGQGPAAINYGTGNVNVNVGVINCTNINCLQFNDTSIYQNQSVSVFNIGQMYSHGNTAAVIWYGATSLGQQEFINCDTIQSDTDPAIMDSVGGSDKQYITALKIANHSTTLPVIYYANSEGTNQVWITAQKIQDNLGGGLIGYGTVPGHSLTNAALGKMFYTCQQWVVEASTFDNACIINGGTHVFYDGLMTVPNGRGFFLEGGANVTLNDMTIDTSASNHSTNNCIFIATGSVNATLNNCTLISAPGVEALSATNAQTVTLNNCRIVGNISTNITVRTTGTNYFSNIIGNFAGNGSGITNQTFGYFTNIVVGGIYTNNTPLSMDWHVNGQVSEPASVLGFAELDAQLMPPSGGAFQIVGALRIAGGVTGLIATNIDQFNFTVPPGWAYTITNSTSGSGYVAGLDPTATNQLVFRP